MFSNREVREWTVLAAVCGFLFFFGLSYFGLVGADEPRYAQVAREMLARHDWVTPVLGGTPWLEKPVLYYWQAIIAYRLFGITDWAARLPSAVDAALMVVAVFIFLRRFRPGFQLDGALIVASSAAVIGFARAASTDMPLAAMFTIAMLAWYAWHETSSKFSLGIFYAFVGFGVLAKGPVAVFLAVVIIGAFAFLIRDLRVIKRTLWIPGLLLFCAVALPWYVLVQLRNPEFLRTFILQHNLERFGSNLYHHHQPFWFYVPVALLGLAPWTAFAVDAVVVEVRRRWNKRQNLQNHDSLGLLLLLWLVVPIVFFSISQSKLPGYILPALPAGALLITDYLARIQGQKFKTVVIVFHALLSAALIIFAVMLSPMLAIHHFPWWRSTAFICAIAIGLAGVCALFLAKYNQRALRFATLFPLLIAVSAILKIGAPALDNSLSARPVARELLQGKNLPVSVFEVRRELEYGLQFYLNQNIPRYELNQIPSGEHIVVAYQGLREELHARIPMRKMIYLGSFPVQHLDFYWVSAK
jgi:4-amino-4-deoxy-L-arabinose transferase-like glycosyltransferase